MSFFVKKPEMEKKRSSGAVWPNVHLWNDGYLIAVQNATVAPAYFLLQRGLTAVRNAPQKSPVLNGPI